MTVSGGVRVAIDRGGTFCDFWAFIPTHLVPRQFEPRLVGNADIIPCPEDGSVQITFKVLSVDPGNYDDAPSEGIRRILQLVEGREIARGQLYDSSIIDDVRVGTTVATNALLERKGARFGLVVTAGFRDLLKIGDQTRPDLFDLAISRKAQPLYRDTDVVEADERVTMEGWSLNPKSRSPQELVEQAGDGAEAGRVEIGISGDAVRIIQPLDTEKVKADLEKLYAKGIRSLAVALLQSYTFPDHERKIADIARKIGFTQISLSSELSPYIKIVQRGNSAAVDAYLSPVLNEYVNTFKNHFLNGLPGRRTDFMKSDGGLTSSETFSGLNAVLSGPAGGFVGCALTADSKKRSRAVIGFDMGGTSTDVCRFSGEHELRYENVVANIKMACPQLAIETVAAGGGSKLAYKNGMFVVGPESVGAHPGPVCYRKGGQLAVTDANLVLGHLVPEHFPSIFGPNADQPLDIDASLQAFTTLTSEINASRPDAKPYTVKEVAAGFLRVANEGMSRPMRQLTEQRGYAIPDHDLCCFGGAGGQHAAAVAKLLGIRTIVVPRFSSILSAYGIACAKLTAGASVSMTRPVDRHFAESKTYAEIEQALARLAAEVEKQLVEQGVRPHDIEYTSTVAVHYDGADSQFHLPLTETFRSDFEQIHLKETSFSMARPISIASLRVQGSGSSYQVSNADFGSELETIERKGSKASSKPNSTQSASFDTNEGVITVDTPVFKLGDLAWGCEIIGPALIADATQTIVVEPDTKASILKEHVVLQVNAEASVVKVDAEITTDPIMLAVFANRFMSIAEQMGHTLQRTSISVSIKERLDFSCSVHGTDGALVANAPHIPIHLGSMQFAVMSQHKHWLGKLRPGDVLLTNHPQWGGTHLPDLTVVTPIFGPDSDTEVLYYVASRGHHTDIGGSGVTSMNPVSKELWEEGMHVGTFKLVQGGRFDEEGVISLFEEAGKYPGTSATRRIDHNITDLHAAVSANARGSRLIQQLFDEYGTAYVQHYMKEIQKVAESTVRRFFRDKHDQFRGRPLRIRDYMDDGTEIVLEVRLNKETGSADFDFTGTGPQSHGNFNMPPSLTHAAIIYALRSMISPDIPMPLNQGVMDPVNIISPKGTYINPCDVVAISGSTIAIHRVIDMIFMAFEAAACSQGCASATGFGTGGKDAFGVVQPGFTYGESMGGGTGAGPSWHGKDATHVHCTNTRLTDPEIVELRTPLLLRHLRIRKGSGGRGRYQGGDGMDRMFEARVDQNVSIVSQRRVFAPLGMKGGENGARGLNIWKRKREDGGYDEINLGHNAMCKLRKGDQVRVLTPGGGGWGHEASC